MLDHQKYKTYQPYAVRQDLQSLKSNQNTLLQQLRNQFKSIKSIHNSAISPIRQSPQQFQYSHENNKQQPKMIVSMNLEEVFQLNEKLQKDNKILQRQNELIEADYQQMKKSYFIEKQRAKEFSIDLQFNEGIYLSILRDVLKGVDKNQINRKVQKQIRSYKVQYPKYCQNGLLQAIEMINQKGMVQIPSKKAIKLQNLGTQQLKGLRQQLDEIIPSNKQKQQCKICLAYQDDIQIFKKELQRRNKQNLQLKLSVTQLSNQILTLTAQSKKKQMDIDRYQAQVKNLDLQIQELTSINQKLNARIISIDQKNNQLQQQHFNQLSIKHKQLKRFLQQENIKLRQQVSQSQRQQIQTARFNENKQKQILAEMQRLSQMLSSEKQRHEIQLLSLNSYSSQLQKQLRQTLEEIKKLKNHERQYIELSRVNGTKMNQMLDHLWKIKEIQFDNLSKYLHQVKKKQ